MLIVPYVLHAQTHVTVGERELLVRTAAAPPLAAALGAASSLADSGLRPPHTMPSARCIQIAPCAHTCVSDDADAMGAESIASTSASPADLFAPCDASGRRFPSFQHSHAMTRSPHSRLSRCTRNSSVAGWMLLLLLMSLLFVDAQVENEPRSSDAQVTCGTTNAAKAGWLPGAAASGGLGVCWFNDPGPGFSTGVTPAANQEVRLQHTDDIVGTRFPNSFTWSNTNGQLTSLSFWYCYGSSLTLSPAFVFTVPAGEGSVRHKHALRAHGGAAEGR
jgi:hypothetical protein